MFYIIFFCYPYTEYRFNLWKAHKTVETRTFGQLVIRVSRMGIAMLPVLKILQVTLLLLSTSIHILGDKDVPPRPVDPCKTTDCEECEDCADDCLIFNCTNCQEEFVITRSCALAMLTAGGVGVPVTMGFLGLFGFAAVGVSSGSLAALWQSTMAGVKEGCLLYYKVSQLLVFHFLELRSYLVLLVLLCVNSVEDLDRWPAQIWGALHKLIVREIVIRTVAFQVTGNLTCTPGTYSLIICSWFINAWYTEIIKCQTQ